MSEEETPQFQLGSISEKLAGHSREIADVRSLVSDLASEMRDVHLSIQSLTDQAEDSERTVARTAESLADAADVRLEKLTVGLPFQKFGIWIGVIGVLVGIGIAVWSGMR